MNKKTIVISLVIVALLVAGGIYIGLKGKGQSASSAPKVSDEQQIQNVINAMLSDSEKVKAQADVLTFVHTYYTPEALTRFQAAMAKISLDSSTGDSMVKTIQSLPDPSLLNYVSTVVASSTDTKNQVSLTAVATYQFKDTTQVNLDGKMQPSKGKGMLNVALEKDNDRWLIDTMAFSIE